MTSAWTRPLAGWLLVAASMTTAAAQEVSPPAAQPEAAAPPPAAPAEKPLKALPENFGEAVGLWDLSLDGSNRRCVLTLAAENGANGRIVRFPAGCRRALPLLAEVAGWLFADGGVRLIDRNVRPLLQFSARADKQSLLAKSERGEAYSLVPLQTVAMLQPLSEPAPAPPVEGVAPDGAAVGDVPGLRQIPGSQPVLPANAIAPRSPGPAPGIYALDRFSEKDVCRIELGSEPPTGKDAASARLLPGCRDNGITVFDPATWRFANGHMTLRSTRGHAVNLVVNGDGSWRRDPDVGTTFVLRRVAP